MKGKAGKRRGFVLLDWLLLLVFALGLYAGLRFYWKRKNDALPSTEIVYMVALRGVDASYGDLYGGWQLLIPNGAGVLSANGTAMLGTVRELEIQPHLVATVREEQVFFAEDPNRVDLFVNVYGKGIARDGDGIRIHDVRIAAGGVGDWRIGSLWANNAQIVSVKELVE